MKKILCLIVCSAVISALASCSFFEGGNASEDSTEVRNIAALPDSVMKQLAKQDSAMNILTEKVNALANGLNKAQDENVKLKEEVAELKKPHALVTIVSIGALFLAFVALIVALLMPRGIKKTVVGIVKQCLDSSTRIKKLQNDMEEMKLLQQKSTSKSTVTYAPSNHDSRVEWLERRMSQAEQAIQNISQPPVQPAKPFVETGGQRVGYAKNESGLYFFTIFDSAQEGCVFKISFINPQKGRFTIISLDKLKSRNDWQQKVECSGVSIKDATDFQLEDEGVCEKIDENTWKVTRPLKIKLLLK